MGIGDFRRGLLLCLAFAAGLLLTVAPGAGAKVKVLKSEKLDSRLTELTLSTPNVDGPTGVRVLLPAGYGSSSRNYPVLYLLHGAIDDYRSWTDKGDAEALTAGLPLIVVMPDSGPSDGYTNWDNPGPDGQPAWERYHIEDLIPFIDQRFRTRADRAGRAVAGLSMGGYGAMIYAAKHPDLFTAAAAFSGAVNLTNPLLLSISTPTARGDYATHKLRFESDNPLSLAENLGGIDLTLRTGDGSSGGPLDPDGGFDIVESVVHASNVSLHDRLGELGIGHVWEDYGPGNHTWPYWQRDLKKTLPGLMKRFRDRTPAPKRITFKSADSSYGAYGWSVKINRKAGEFSMLSDAGRNGFGISGSGRATVRTAPLLRKCRRFSVTIRDVSGKRKTVRHTGRKRRLEVKVNLGPANPFEQFTPEDEAAGHHSASANVSFKLLGKDRCGKKKRGGHG
ncbi:MAG TPA: alpha/beta hydrolase family protein [Solirubrobacterales bacterium]|nr:esterase family protein [Solirubrobacterales bacterium]HRV59127.1 alpha/beta hydrolase family protein [Solirubrobacterales bacterium]